MKLNDFSNAASEVLFGENYSEHFFAFSVLVNVVFVSALVSVLLYFKIIQKIISLFAFLMKRTFRLTGVEAFVSSLNIFLGQTEAPLFVKPYLANVTRSELSLIMSVGMATISASLVSAYAGMGINGSHLTLATITSVFSALIFSKIIIPETEISIEERENANIKFPKYQNVIDAAGQGGKEGSKLAVNIGIMLIVFVGLTTMINSILGLFHFTTLDISLESISGLIYRPFVYLLGLNSEEIIIVSNICGVSTIFNEFIAYANLSSYSGVISSEAFIGATYSICNFANIGSIAIQIGAFSLMVPNRKSDVISLSIKALIIARLSSFMTAYLVLLVIII